MEKRIKKNNFELVVYGAVLITLITTPFFNKDSLIIPKVIVLFLLGIFLLPVVFENLSDLKTSRITTIFGIISGLIIIQILLVSLVSDAPLEQLLFGRTGRGIGILTLISIVVLSLVSVMYGKLNHVNVLNFGLAISGVLVSIYAIIQYFEKDPFGWDSKTNGIISTLGNPNFVSSFIAMTIFPAFVYVKNMHRKYIYQVFLAVIFLFAIYIAESTQGYVNTLIAGFTFLLIFYLYRSKAIFYLLFTLFISVSLVAILGMLNKGPLASYLYKISVQSRGDFWRAAFNSIDSNPIFGVGLDSFGDHYLRYRDEIAVSHPWAEYTDSAHNYFLDYAVNGGIVLGFLHISLTGLLLLSLFRLRKSHESFNAQIAGLFSSASVYFAQSFISPMNISLLMWGNITMGFLIGMNKPSFKDVSKQNLNRHANKRTFSVGSALALIALPLVFSYFNSDRLQLIAMNNGNGNLAIKSAKMFPESTIRYYTLSKGLFDAGLQIQSLDLAYSAVIFNPNSAALWSLILVNPSAPLSDRIKAKEEILRLDPLNKDIPNYVLNLN